jgi:hypothetical protein
MTAETTTAVDASGAVAFAEEAIGRAHRTVEDLHDTVIFAIRVLQDAEFDSAKSRLSDRGDFYLEAAAEHMGRLQSRCGDMRELSEELTNHLEVAARMVDDASSTTNQLSHSPDPVVVQEGALLATRLDVLAEMVDLALPVADLVTKHVENARQASLEVIPSGLLEPRSLEHSIRSAGHELERTDEDLCVLETVVERAERTARQSAGVATELVEHTRRCMNGHRDGWPGAGSSGFPGAQPQR